MPNLAEIAHTSGVAVRKLRYVLDHQILSGSQDASQGRGTARSFTPFEAFALVTAALMLRAGLRRPWFVIAWRPSRAAPAGTSTKSLSTKRLPMASRPAWKSGIGSTSG